MEMFPYKVGDLSFTELRPLKSEAGWYIGRLCDDGFCTSPGTRESGYYATVGKARAALTYMDFVVRDCVENNALYEAGLPRPEVKCG